MRTLVCGGRDFADWRHLQATLERLHAARQISLVISGGASGADDLAARWGLFAKLPVCVFPANWKHLGRAAGPARNRHMLDFGMPDLVVAFAGGSGTAHMVRIAKEAGVEVVEA